MLTTAASFPKVFLNSFTIQSSVEVFKITGLLWWQKLTTVGICRIFNKIFIFRSGILLLLKISRRFSWNGTLTRSDARFKLGSGIISRTNHNSLLLILTNETASFFVENCWHHIPNFVFAKVEKSSAFEFISENSLKKKKKVFFSVVVCFFISLNK